MQLSRLLRTEGAYQVFIGTLDANGPLWKEAERISQNSIPEYRLNSFYDVNFWSQTRRCVDYLKKMKIDIIHTHDFYTNVFGMMAGFLAGVPVRIASKRNTLSKTRNQMLVERQAFRAADRVVVNADANRKVLVEKGVPAEKIEIIYNGIIIENFRLTVLQDRDQVLELLGLQLSRQAKFVTIVANLRSRVKNHHMFLRSAKRVRAACPEAEFLIAGEGELANELRSKAAELGIESYVHFTGRCDHLPELLSVSDVCVLSSTSEGFSNALLEYMAASRPVVATRVGGAEEAVIEGETGFLVDCDDDAAMATNILKLLNDRAMARRFGERAREIVEDRFSETRQLVQTLDLYDRLLAKKRRASTYV